jgi:2-keto-4-pentenoate hydratase/2-oxohepta-3-ene-1,7-dioic acid hydratase in catechol pathway
MRLASYVADGKAGYGVVVGEDVVTVSRTLGGRYPTLRHALTPEGLATIRQAAADAAPDHKLADIRFLPAVPDPQKIVCAGINYRAHAAETGRELPKQPSMFARFVDTLVGHDGEMVRPKISTHFDFEGELAVVIGRPGRYIKAADALAHVAGYTIFVDGSVRDYQKFSVISGKNFPATGPLGPWIVTTDELPDPHKLTLTTRLNGQVMQKSGTDILIHDVPAIVAFVSSFTALSPGDIIATGTPDGVGHSRNPPLWMKAGDVLEVEISGIGTLRSRIVDEQP